MARALGGSRRFAGADFRNQVTDRLRPDMMQTCLCRTGSVASSSPNGSAPAASLRYGGHRTRPSTPRSQSRSWPRTGLDADDLHGRFLTEAKLLRRAESDHLVRVHDLGELPYGRPYLVMTFADGGTLEDRLGNGPLAWREAVGVTVESATRCGLCTPQGAAS